jgi:hypothetical protein
MGTDHPLRLSPEKTVMNNQKLTPGFDRFPDNMSRCVDRRADMFDLLVSFDLQSVIRDIRYFLAPEKFIQMTHE